MSIKRAKIYVNGIVQGVGFRPFIHKQIASFKLFGWVRNTSTGAEIELEGEEELIRQFADELWTKAPRLSLIAKVDLEWQDGLLGYDKFEIIASDAKEKRDTLISPDVSICEECLEEMRSPGDRYRYPFINCTNCGPRFTIIKDVPYDRAKTTMAPFKMCDKCYGQYTFIEDRRYHAEPTGCNICGPKQYFLDKSGERISCYSNEIDKFPKEKDPIEIAKQYIRDGKILAIKGLGGFHLACRFDDATIPALLRSRKHRDEKPFAIMCKDLETARKYCDIDADEEKILSGHRRPIVLLKKRADKLASAPDFLSQISENNRVGIMLPYTPVQYMLFEEDITALVMTSANLSDTPIIYKDEEALEKLSGIADGFLTSNREIHVRCDDSLCYVFDGAEYPVRRSRGFVPYPIIMDESLPPILACGAEQKASFALSKGNYVIPSQHIGDMKNIETFDNYAGQIEHFKRLFDIKPKMLVCDMHPDYMSTTYAMEKANEDDAQLLMVQHHHAHMASCMADNNLDGKVLGLIWDGVGYGMDGNSWGGEFLVGDYEDFKRVGQIRYMKLPGGDKATKQLYRTGISLLVDAGVDPAEIFEKDLSLQIIKQLSLDINCPLSSGMGRLFDGVAAIIGIKTNASYEGQGAILLEAAAVNSSRIYNYQIKTDEGRLVLDYRPMIREIANDVRLKKDKGIIAAAFINTLIEAAAEMSVMISKRYDASRVVLSGGTFNNMYIMSRLPKLLESKGLKVYHHHRVSCGDEGLSLGQLLIGSRKFNQK